jgi:hypothetical protein
MKQRVVDVAQVFDHAGFSVVSRDFLVARVEELTRQVEELKSQLARQILRARALGEEPPPQERPTIH